MAYECVLKCGNPCHPSDTISQGKWETLHSKANNWRDHGKFGDVYNTTLWEDGPGSRYVHKTCYLSISSTLKLERARRRSKNENDLAQLSSQKSSSEMQAQAEPEGPSPPKRLRSSVCGPLHINTKCVWCMQGADTKHPGRARGKLCRLNTYSAWQAFKRHTVLIEDEDLRDRLNRLVISTTALSDPIANYIKYHPECYRKYISNVYFKPGDAIHLQNVRLSEAQNLFFRYVDSVIFTEHEIRSL